MKIFENKIGYLDEFFGSVSGSDTTGYSSIKKDIRFNYIQYPFIDDQYKSYNRFLSELMKNTSLIDKYVSMIIHLDTLYIVIDKSYINTLSKYLNSIGYIFLLSLSCTHFYDKDINFFTLIYLIEDIEKGDILRCILFLEDGDKVRSIVDIYPTVGFQESEVYDMFGIEFLGNDNLSRIIMPDDWNGYPQRKDYPLGGIPIKYKDNKEIESPDKRRYYI